MAQTTTLTGRAALARGVREAGAGAACAAADAQLASLLDALRAHPSIDIRPQAGDEQALEAALASSRSGCRTAFCRSAPAAAAHAEHLAAAAGKLGAGLAVIVPAAAGPECVDLLRAARAAKLPVLAPAHPQQALDLAKLAFTLSERHAVPVLLLLPAAVADTEGACRLAEPEQPRPPEPAPAVADAAAFLDQQLAALEQQAATAFDWNPVVIGSPNLGIVACGAAAAAVAYVLPGASLLTLGLANPLPRKLVAYFAGLARKLVVVEDGAPCLEEQIAAMGIEFAGRELPPACAGYDVVRVFAEEIAKAPDIVRPAPAGPPAMPVVPRRLGVRSFDEMLALVKTLPKRRVAIAGGQNLAALHAGIECMEMGLGTPVYVGPREAIRRLAGEKFPDFDIDGVEIVEAADDQAIAARAVELVRNGDAGILLKGGVNTPTLMKAALASGTGLRSGSLLSDSFLFEYPDEDGIRLIAITDGGLNQQPTAQQKIDILKNAVVVSHALGNPDPRVGMLAASETVSPNLPASMDAAVTMHMNRAGRIAGCIVEGPIALDVAVSRKAAAIKGTDSDVAGQVDILVASSIDTANALAKSTTYFAGYRLAHVIVGATAPILIASRSDSSDAKLLSIALGSLMAKYFEEQRGA